MHVWVDQDLCTGDALCTELCPEIFTMVDGLSYVCVDGKALVPGGSQRLAPVPANLMDAVIDAAEECPGECIFIEA